MIRINFPDQTYLDVIASDESYRYRSIMGKYEVTLKFSLTEYVHFASGCWIDYKGQTYYCLTEGNLKKNARNEYEYSVTFEPHAGKLRLWTLRNYATDEFKFSAAYTPREAVEVIVETLNNRDGGWNVGECLESDHKTFDFNNTKLDTALSMIASEFNTEYEIVDKTIHLRKVEYGKDTPLALSYGKGNGFLPGVGVVSTGKQAQFEILLIQGGEQNLDRSRYGSPRWHLPKNAQLEYNGVTYQTDAKGREVTIAGKQLTSKVDLTLDLSEMYPKRVGVISAVEVIDAESRFVDILDSSIPEDLDYSGYRSAGETATITFQSGMLAGRTFDIEQSADSLTGYIHAERRFKLVPKTEDGIEMPDTKKGVFMPAVGDKYAVFGVMLPDAYINSPSSKTGVEWDMFREACRYFDEKNVVPFNFTGTIDPNWARQDWINRGGMLEPGWFVRFSDPDFKPDGYDIRVVGMRDYANDACKVSIELSNDVVSSNLSTEFAKIDGEQQRLDREKSALKDYSKRGYADVLRTTEMLIGAGLSGFTESVQPLTVQTMQLLVGATECQFVFVDSKTDPQSVVSKAQVFDRVSKQFTCEAGILKHLTIGIDYVSASHKVDEYHYWDMPPFTSAALTDKAGYYVYARCSKTGSTGAFKLSQTAIQLESETGYYHFLVGILNPEIDGTRSYAPMYGFSAIEPGRMIVDRIQSSDFDWDTFAGACIDLSSNPRRIILGDNAEIITRKLIIRPPEGEDYDLVETVENTYICGENLASSYVDDWIYTTRPYDNLDGYEEDYGYLSTKTLIDIKDENTSKILIEALEAANVSTDYSAASGMKIVVQWYGADMQFSGTESNHYVQIPQGSTTKVSAALDIPNNAKYMRIAMRYYGNDYWLTMDQFKELNPISRDSVKFGVYLGSKVNGYVKPARNYLSEAIKKGSTSIQGGLVLGNILATTPVGQEGNTSAVRSGMSGIDGDGVAFFAHGSDAYNKAVQYANPSTRNEDNRPNFLISDIGELFAKNADIRGFIQASEGEIGNFTISDGEIVGFYNDGTDTHEIKLTPNLLADLSTLKNIGMQTTIMDPVADSERQYVWGDYVDAGAGGIIEIFETHREHNVGSFTLSEASLCYFDYGVKDIETTSLYGGAEIRFSVHIILTKENGSDAHYNPNIPLLNAGTYNVKIVFEGWFVKGSLPSSVRMNFKFYFNGAKRGQNNKTTTIAANGIASFFNEAAYFYFSKDYGFELRTGRFGIKCDTNGLQRFNIDNSWSAL